MRMSKARLNSPKASSADFRDQLESMKTSLSTSLGAIDAILLGGVGEVSEEQRRFLGVAKRNLENLFVEIQKFIDSGKAESRK